MGIEPTPSAWKAEVLPLNYTRPESRRAPEKPLPPTLSAGCSTDFPGRSSPGGGGRIRTFEGVSRQIYSLLPLTAWVPHREKRAAYSDFHSPECQFELARLLLVCDHFFDPPAASCLRSQSQAAPAAAPWQGHTSYIGGVGRGFRWIPSIRLTGSSRHWPDRRSSGSSTGP